jgi:hypothetical protein
MKIMRTKVFVLMVTMLILLFSFITYADEDDRQASGYYSTDLWLLGVTPYKPIALDHSVLSGVLSQGSVRSLESQGYLFVYKSNEYDIVVNDPLIIAIFYINGFTSNIICLGDVVK